LLRERDFAARFFNQMRKRLSNWTVTSNRPKNKADEKLRKKSQKGWKIFGLTGKIKRVNV